MKKKLFSLLLAAMMVISVAPLQPFAAYASDREDAVTCPLCGHERWGNWLCEECGICSEEADTDCFVESHCEDCGTCLALEGIFCSECHSCEGCMIGNEDHCSECYECYNGDSDSLCWLCRVGPCCRDICDDCGLCEYCQESIHAHCPECYSCFQTVDYCLDTGTTYHCENECIICDQCGTCLYEEGIDLCEDCNLCPDCCRENAEAEGCSCGEYCIESSDWFEHICENCGVPFCDTPQCEICELCINCCEENSECDDGMCVEDPDYEDHFCMECGDCFHIVNQCETCSENNEMRCETCCAKLVKEAGCTCDDQCISQPGFENHLKTEHSSTYIKNHGATPESRWDYDATYHWLNCSYCDLESHRTKKAAHDFDKYGNCKICGASNSSAMVIMQQPKDANSAVPDYNSISAEDKYHESNLSVRFYTAVYSVSKVSYQWYQKAGSGSWVALKDDVDKIGNVTYPIVSGAKTATLKICPPVDACYTDYSYKCVITNTKGNKIETKTARLFASHIYDKAEWVGAHKGQIKLANGKTVHIYEDKGHTMACHGDGCEAVKKKVYRHRYGYTAGKDSKEIVTDEKGGKWWVRTCKDCGFKKYLVQHDHDFHNAEVDFTYDSYSQHKLICTYNGISGSCEETTLEPHAWTNWQNVGTPWTNNEGVGAAYRSCVVCSHWSKDYQYRYVDGTFKKTQWTKKNDLVYVQYGTATSDIVVNGDNIDIIFSPSDYEKTNLIKKANPYCYGWKVYYTPKKSHMDDKTDIDVTKYFTFTEAYQGSKYKVSCNITTNFSGYKGGGVFSFIPKISNDNCKHTGATETVLKTDPVCVKNGYTGNVICLQCGGVKEYGHVIPGSDTHTGNLTVIPGSAKTGDCYNYGHEADKKCDKCGLRVPGKITPKVHKEVVKDAKAATLTEPGYSGDTYCSICGILVKTGKEIPQLSNEIKTVELFHLNAPKENASPDYDVTKPENVKYGTKLSQYPIIWRDETTGTVMNKDSKFVAGRAYSVLIPVFAADKYIFANYGDLLSAVNATIDGKRVSVRRYEDNSLDGVIGVYCYFGECDDSVVNEVKLNNVSVPVAGQTPKYTGDVMGTGYVRMAANLQNWQVQGMNWRNHVKDYILDKTDIIEPNGVYICHIELVAQDGYTFDNKTKASVNGKKANVVEQTATTIKIECTFLPQIQVMDTISVSNIKEPVVGSKPEYDITLPKDAVYTLDTSFNNEYTVNGIMWGTVTNGNPSSFSRIAKTDKFVSGKQYAISLDLYPKELDGQPVSKFDRSNPPTVIFNGEVITPSLLDVTYGGSSASLIYVFPTLHSHSYSWVKAENSHYKECSCGEKKDIGVHVYDNDKDTTCNTCGYVRTIKDTHSHSYTTLKHNGDYHWYECSCGNKVSFEEHIYSNDKDATCNVCGFDRYHTHSYDTKKSNSTQHWYECSCGAKKDIEKHEYLEINSCATLSKNGKISKRCAVCGYQPADTVIYMPKTFTLSKSSFTYDGKAHKPTVTVKDSKGKVIDKSNYLLEYSKGRKDVGSYTVKVIFDGDKYYGTKKLTFKINPKATELSSLSAKSKGFTAKWKKQTTQTTGYEIQYATDSKFTKNKKTVTVKSNKTTSKAASSLKGKTKYYVRIRTYKTVNKTKYYSSWSKFKTVTTKK
ncbi:MAG: fibronectin type III domain-containing protein [Ruminococcaceae bacterium]|nr:fibronectin type III domain-containing protein [Oscillospiraceae bacterium]